MDENEVIHLDFGAGNALCVYEDHVVTLKSGYIGSDRVTAKTTIHYSIMTRIQHKEPGFLSKGHIEFSFYDNEGGISVDTITFGSSFKSAAREAYEYIRYRTEETWREIAAEDSGVE